METQRIGHWIDGAIVYGTSGRSGPVFDPARGHVQAHVDFADLAEVDAVVASCKRAGQGR
jgi:malonate-semialdehyde dehydrogenase (acetylating)/methylmalonate-semialdehyde dehydrogenase